MARILPVQETQRMDGRWGEADYPFGTGIAEGDDVMRQSRHDKVTSSHHLGHGRAVPINRAGGGRRAIDDGAEPEGGTARIVGPADRGVRGLR